MSEHIHEGGCLCGAIRYRATAEPVALSLCHCRTCRVAAGTPSVAWAIFRAQDFAFIVGQPHCFRSSRDVERTFCDRCGTSLTYRNSTRAEFTDVTTATLDSADRFAPTCEIWIEQKLAWEALSDTRPHYPRSSRD